MPDRVLLIGAGGKTGEPYAKLLQAHGHHVLWYDKNSALKPDNLDETKLTHLASDSLNFSKLQNDFDWLTLTPGVPLKHPFVAEARAAGKKILSEIAYVAPYLKNFRIIGITGTDGKSTTTTLIAQLLNLSGVPAIECGNFGIPLSQIALKPEAYANKILVCELSSYQLEEPGSLSLEVAIFLNLAPDHLNRYNSVEEYGLAKWNILRLLSGRGTALVAKNLTPSQTPYWQHVHPLKQFLGSVVEIDTENLISPNFNGNDIESTLMGRHNTSNLLFAFEAVRIITGNRPNLDLAKQLHALPHRFEKIIQVQMPHITFINDSKATTTQAAMVALANSPSPVFIFLGGQGKGERYQDFARALKTKDATALIYGECKNDMAADFREAGYTNYTLHDNLFKAFHTAKRMVAQQKLATATLLLSPAVTSWDQFSSFEERGDYFRNLVESLDQRQ